MALLLVDDLHPINGSFYDVSFPWLCCLCGSVRKWREKRRAFAPTLNKHSDSFKKIISS
jgi:hypothetical protein